MSPNLTLALREWNEVEGGVTPPALRYSRTSTITCMRLSQSLLIDDQQVSHPARVCIVSWVAAPTR